MSQKKFSVRRLTPSAIGLRFGAHRDGVLIRTTVSHAFIPFVCVQFIITQLRRWCDDKVHVHVHSNVQGNVIDDQQQVDREAMPAYICEVVMVAVPIELATGICWKHRTISCSKWTIPGEHFNGSIECSEWNQ